MTRTQAFIIKVYRNDAALRTPKRAEALRRLRALGKDARREAMRVSPDRFPSTRGTRS